MLLAAPEEVAQNPWGGGAAAGFSHLAAGQRWGRERPSPGQYLGRGRGEGGLARQACGEQCTMGVGPGQRRPPPRRPGLASPASLGRDIQGGRCPVSGSVGRAGAPPACSHGLGRMSFSEPWASWALEPLPGHPGGWAWLWVRGLSWCRAGTVAEAWGARPPPAPGSQRGPPAARPCAWPAPSG